MRRVRCSLRPGAALCLALAWFLDENGLVAAALAAAAVHESGHILALRRCGAHITRVTLGLAGAEIGYAGALTRREEGLAAAAGPAFGALWALFALTPGGFLARSGAASAVLTVFNLLPVLPLDGGRLLAVLAGEGRARRVSRAAALLLLAAGAALCLVFHTPWLLLSAAWLTLCNFCSSET